MCALDKVQTTPVSKNRQNITCLEEICYHDFVKSHCSVIQYLKKNPILYMTITVTFSNLIQKGVELTDKCSSKIMAIALILSYHLKNIYTWEVEPSHSHTKVLMWDSCQQDSDLACAKLRTLESVALSSLLRFLLSKRVHAVHVSVFTVFYM